MSTSAMENNGKSQQLDGGFIDFIPDGSTIPKEVWQSRHKYFVIAVLTHIPILFAIGLFEGTEAITGATLPEIPLETLLLELGIIAVFALAATISRLDRRIRTVLAVTGLAFCSGTLVHVTGGYIEAHFHFFVAIGIAAIYEDWVPFGIGIGYVVLTHGLFGMIDPSRVYNHTAAQLNPWVWGLIHGAFVAMLALALTVHLSSIEKSRRKAQHELERARERATRIDDLEKRQAEIQEQKEEAERLKAEAEDQRAEVEALNAHLQQKAEEYQQAMERAADGDLTVRVTTDSESEAMAGIGRSFNEMLSDLETAVSDIQSFAETVQTQTEDADTSTRQAATASDDISESIQEIAAGTEDQRDMLNQVSGEMSDLSATIEEIAASAQEVVALSDETATVATDGEALTEEMINDAKRVQESIDRAVETVTDLQRQMDEIAEITNVISEIADQTNMLALNASIEAARAGGDSGGGGEGFDVVASEVKQLAEETQDSAGDIQTRIAETQEKTDRVVSDVEEASELIEQEIAAVADVADAFDQVAENAQQTDDGVKEISRTTDNQAASSEEVVSMIDQVVEISEDSASEAETVSATVEEQAASMNEVSDTVSTIAGRTDKLSYLLATFTTSGNNERKSATPTATPVAGADH